MVANEGMVGVLVALARMHGARRVGVSQAASAWQRLNLMGPSLSSTHVALRLRLADVMKR